MKGFFSFFLPARTITLPPPPPDATHLSSKNKRHFTRQLILIVSVAIHSSLSLGQSSSLATSCKVDGYQCGTCEEKLQNDLNTFLNEITQDDLSKTAHWGSLKDDLGNHSDLKFKEPKISPNEALKKIIDIMKENNPEGDNQLNYIVIGESESLQQTSIKNGKMNPRIMLKSPNSELMVTFATDPELPGYNSIEMMRWNGKKGRYEFQELNFENRGEPPHIDLSGEKCLACHKSPSMRPNWDTYRAWAGVIPSRDDMLEMHFKSRSREIDRSKDMQPDARAYISFLEQIADAQLKGSKNDSRAERLAMLDIPFDRNDQLRTLVDERPIDERSFVGPKEKIEIIKRKVERDGFYRIRHFPDKTMTNRSSSNFDVKTASKAGPSQFAFDQMLAQNMCRVAVTLKENPYYEVFKYALASAMKCGVRDFNDLIQFFPEGHDKKIREYFIATNASTMRETEASVRSTIKDKNPEEIYQMLVDDTERNHNRANQYKFDRHSRFLERYLLSVEGMEKGEAQTQARYYSEDVLTPTQSGGYHAIGDPGGVRGVGEDATYKISTLRFLLGPYGVHVEHWSLVNGKDNAYHSYSFSDQFALFEEQELFSEIMKEIGEDIGDDSRNAICQEMRKRSREALSRPVLGTNGSEQNCEISLINDENFDFQINTMSGISSNHLEEEAKVSLKTCLMCHGSGGFMEFSGLSEFVESGEESNFRNFLNSQSQTDKLPYYQLIEYKLGLHGIHSYGGEMPPIDFADNEEFSEKYGIKENVQEERKIRLALYLSSFAKGSSNTLKGIKKCNCPPNTRKQTYGTLQFYP